MEGPVGIASPPATWSLETAYAYATARAVPPTEPNGEPLYNCPFPPCGKQFSKRFNLKAHLRVHTGDKPFACSYPGCTRRFMWKSSLTSHQTGHSRRKAEMAKRNAVMAGKTFPTDPTRAPYIHYQQQQQHQQPQQQPHHMHPNMHHFQQQQRHLHPQQYYPAHTQPQQNPHIIHQTQIPPPSNTFPLQSTPEPSMSYITAEDSHTQPSARSHIQQLPQSHPQRPAQHQHSQPLSHHPQPQPQSSLPISHQPPQTQPQQHPPIPPDQQHPEQFTTPHHVAHEHNPHHALPQRSQHPDAQTRASNSFATPAFKQEPQPDHFSDPQRRFIQEKMRNSQRIQEEQRLQQRQEHTPFKQEPVPDQQFADPQRRFLPQDKMQDEDRIQRQDSQPDQPFSEQRRYMQDKVSRDPQQQLQEEQNRLQRQEREIKEQQRLLKQRQEHYDAELRRVQQLQDEERKRRESDQRQRQGSDSAQVANPSTQASGQSTSQSGGVRHESASLPFGRFEDNQQQFQRPVPPISNGRNGDSSRIVKRESSSVHLSKTSQSLAHATSSLPLPSNQVIPSPLTCGRSPSASGFSQQFLFPSNVSASATSPTWATTPLVPPIPNSSKPPHTPTNQMDVQMAAIDRPGDGSPSVVDVPISPGITSPVPPPMLPQPLTNSRHRRALSGRSSKPPLSGRSLSAGPAALLPPLTNVLPANPPTHIDLGGLTDDEPNSSLPALGSPHTELSPLPVASPIIGLGLTPTSPMQPFSPFGIGSSVPRGKQTASW